MRLHLFGEFPQLKRTFWPGEIWSPCYFVRSEGEGVNAEAVKRYIEAHDQRATKV